MLEMDHEARGLIKYEELQMGIGVLLESVEGKYFEEINDPKELK